MQKTLKAVPAVQVINENNPSIGPHKRLHKRQKGLIIDRRKNLRLLLFEMYDWFNRQLKLQSKEMN